MPANVRVGMCFWLFVLFSNGWSQEICSTQIDPNDNCGTGFKITTVAEPIRSGFGADEFQSQLSSDPRSLKIAFSSCFSGQLLVFPFVQGLAQFCIRLPTFLWKIGFRFRPPIGRE